MKLAWLSLARKKNIAKIICRKTVYFLIQLLCCILPAGGNYQPARRAYQWFVLLMCFYILSLFPARSFGFNFFFAGEQWIGRNTSRIRGFAFKIWNWGLIFCLSFIYMKLLCWFLANNYYLFQRTMNQVQLDYFRERLAEADLYKESFAEDNRCKALVSASKKLRESEAILVIKQLQEKVFASFALFIISFPFSYCSAFFPLLFWVLFLAKFILGLLLFSVNLSLSLADHNVGDGEIVKPTKPRLYCWISNWADDIR